MAVKDLIAVLAQSERIRVMKDQTELYMGFIANFTPYEVFEQLKDKTVKKFYNHMELRHKRYKELGLYAPIHPEQTPDYSFSDLQLTSYYTIEI